MVPCFIYLVYSKFVLICLKNDVIYELLLYICYIVVSLFTDLADCLGSRRMVKLGNFSMCAYGGLRFRRIFESKFRVVEERVSAENWLGFDEYLFCFCLFINMVI